MHRLRRSLRSVLNEPVLADRSLDVMAGALWAIYGLWGMSSTISKIPTLDRAASPLYQLIWGGLIGLVALVAAIAAFSTLVPGSTLVRIRKKQAEMWAVSILGGFIGVYPVLIFLEALTGDPARQSIAILSLSYLVVPTWRVYHLVRRIRSLRPEAIPRDRKRRG